MSFYAALKLDVDISALSKFYQHQLCRHYSCQNKQNGSKWCYQWTQRHQQTKLPCCTKCNKPVLKEVSQFSNNLIMLLATRFKKMIYRHISSQCHSNYSSNLYCLRDIANYWSKIAEMFYTLPAFRLNLGGAFGCHLVASVFEVDENNPSISWSLRRTSAKVMRSSRLYINLSVNLSVRVQNCCQK